MQVIIGKKGLEATFQDNFPSDTQCIYCGGLSQHTFTAIENEESFTPKIKNLHIQYGIKGGLWLHDDCAVAVYFCRVCLKPTALFNQA